jgi:outer membrane protein
MQKRIVDFRDNAKELQKESDIVKPLMEKVRTSIQSWKAKVSNTY